MSLSSCRSVLFLVKRTRCFSQVTILVVPAHHGLPSQVKDSWESTTNTLKIMGATMLLSATSNDVGVNVRLVGYGLTVSRYQGIYRRRYICYCHRLFCLIKRS
jgi:hypothetical protein